MRKRSPFLRQKPILYFDENFSAPVLAGFARASSWRKKVKALSAIGLGNRGMSDSFHFGRTLGVPGVKDSGVRVEMFGGREMLMVEREALRALAEAA